DHLLADRGADLRCVGRHDRAAPADDLNVGGVTADLQPDGRDVAGIALVHDDVVFLPGGETGCRDVDGVRCRLNGGDDEMAARVGGSGAEIAAGLVPEGYA